MFTVGHLLIIGVQLSGRSAVM
jgi:hypothetical protein